MELTIKIDFDNRAYINIGMLIDILTRLDNTLRGRPEPEGPLTLKDPERDAEPALQGIERGVEALMRVVRESKAYIGAEATTTPTAPTSVQAQAESTATAAPTTPAAPAPAVTLEEVRAAAKAIAMGGKREELKSLLTEFGAENIPSLDPSKYSDFLLRMKSL